MTNLRVALTYDYQPHGLRSSLVWLPYSILLAYGWFDFLESKEKRIACIWYVLMALQFVVYFLFYILIHRGYLTLYA